MRVRWKIMTIALYVTCATLTVGAAMTASAAEIAFSSQRDFTEISLNIKDTYNANPDAIELDITLSQDAQQRMQAATSAALEQDLTVMIDGQAINTSHVQNVVDTPQMRIVMSRQAALQLLPNLLGGNGGANPPAAPLPPVPPVSSMPPATGNQEPLFAMPPVEAQPQQVVPPTISESAPDTSIAMPGTAAAAPEPDAPSQPIMPTPPISSIPATPPDFGAAPVADPAPTALPTEAAMAPRVVTAVAPPSPAASVPVMASAVPQVPRWAAGAWLPTSATPSPYAEIYTGDAVAISGHALNAINCNQARTIVLESTPQQVRLRVDKNGSCIINKIAVEQLRINPSATPGKVVISLYAEGDDMNGAPASEGSYQRKP
ncbi:Outer membrane protein [Collimonas arenae]|uniref:Outer membrane protein n=2 Tax=Collimonas arenae TaxID=279058 RepID=A0A0A1FI63_9BURK|nr:Outer membrane protein [Collimonas arenae]